LPVPEIIVLGFKDMSRADEVVPQIQKMQGEGLIELADLVRVIRRPDGRIEVRQATSTAGAGAAGGALLGTLVGLLFLMPLAGMALGAVTGAIIGKFADYGIDNKFIKDVSDQVTPGTSALFLYVSRATPDKVIERLKPHEPTVLRTSLSQDAEERLRAAVQIEAQAQNEPLT
jgi:uncharacterized membrane protein